MKELYDFEAQDVQTVEAFGCPCENDPSLCSSMPVGATRLQVANGTTARYF
ncbi:hypothetical protein [Allofournierella sp.]|uniref:hypothetical protein n=1 Tax=Allofournierella sp. TaxID=1940256 RepID=UPI003AB34A3F